MFWWKHATSPVEDISTPSEGSAPGRRLNENCGTFTPTNGSFCCLSHCCFCSSKRRERARKGERLMERETKREAGREREENGGREREHGKQAQHASQSLCIIRKWV